MTFSCQRRHDTNLFDKTKTQKMRLDVLTKMRGG